MRCTTDQRLFSAEDADSPRTFSDLVEPSPNTHQPLTLSCHPPARPSRSSNRPMRCPVAAPCGATSSGLKPASQRIPERPTRKGETHGNPRAPSVVSRPCRLITRRPIPNLQPVQLLMGSRTDSPSLHPCSASGSAWGFLRASAFRPTRSCDLPARKNARCVRPTSAIRTKTMTRSSLVPGSSNRFRDPGRP